MSIAGLDPNEPQNNGLAGLGDDEIRSLKVALQACFPALAGQISNASGTGSNPPTETDFSNLFTRLESVENGGSALIPIGGIIMWSGTVANIPSGWALCNGSTANGFVTPDLRDKFVVGAGDLADGSEFDPGNTGGNAISSGTMATANSGAGSGTASLVINDHVLTEAQMPEHHHKMFTNTAVTHGLAGSAQPGANDFAVQDWATGSSVSNNYVIQKEPGSAEPTLAKTSSVGGSGTPDAITHTGTVDLSVLDHSHDYMPEYYAVAFIAYVGTP